MECTACTAAPNIVPAADSSNMVAALQQVNQLAYEIPKNKYAQNPWNYAPEFLKVFGDVRVHVGGKAVFDCVLLGSPRPKVCWLFNDEKMRFNDIQVDDTADVCRLTIPYVMPYHFGRQNKKYSSYKKDSARFRPQLFMTDDTNSFHDGFMRAFPQSAAVKLFCNFHILQAIKRNCKAKLAEVRSLWARVSRKRGNLQVSRDSGKFIKFFCRGRASMQHRNPRFEQKPRS
ncbi:hypothetical protein TELCIR_06217 [Teladorsagia circumcincta]|uniref:Immunoglobulin I-set domain-containing protein n=1 Tax=Teladorsagia circumcincta TaxID=45464 RepID=A0A2G9UNJ6_TELCI|nr:hypothetical protein TELCIR_06217 [Teladorsagia circumcincta]